VTVGKPVGKPGAVVDKLGGNRHCAATVKSTLPAALPDGLPGFIGPR
jgi:hypothetical protein